MDGSGTTGNTITQNSIFSNDMGIALTYGANGGIAATVSYLTQPYLTATATDGRGTSEFSDAFMVAVPLAPRARPIYLPIILKNH